MESRTLRGALVAALVTLAARAAVPECRAAGLDVVAPRPWQVIQRVGFVPAVPGHDGTPGGAATPGQADVPLAIRSGVALEGATALVRVVPVTRIEEVPPWKRVELVAGDEAGLLVGTLRVPAGGWYRLELRVTPPDGDVLEAGLEPFGVGEVFLVAGQSYATNTNDERLVVADARDRVAALDVAAGAWRIADDPQPVPDSSDGGSIWPAVGDALVGKLDVPVGFVNVAWGGTSSAQWQPGTPLHERLVAAGRDVGRFRAVLWQQGESDVIAHTSTDDYVAALARIRDAAVRGWGFEPPWLLAKSTHHPTVYDDPEGEGRIRAAVDRLASLPGFAPGPDTDTLRGESRGGIGSRCHFSAVGQRSAAALWTTVILERLGRPPRGVEAASFLLADLGLLEPAWTGDVVRRESSVLRAAAAGEPARARLAHPAARILAVATADGREVLEAGKAWHHDAGSAEIVFPHPAPVPPILDGDRYLAENAPHAYRHRTGNPEQWLLYRPGRWFHDRDLEITYERAADADAAPPPVVCHGSLPRSRARLAEGKPVVIGVSGDSISTGLDASETTAAPPCQPGWPDLVVAQLRVATTSDVTHVNRAVAGWSVADGVADIDTLLEAGPDLVIVAYGMNDVGRRDPAWYRERTEAIVRRVQEKRPEADVLLVATMLGNDEWIHTPREMFARYRDELAGLVGEGVALVDMTAVWEDQLRSKEMYDLTGNGLNHPNDFGHRLYARGVLEMLLERAAQ
jgi:lysophospholipase L1-like esterase